MLFDSGLRKENKKSENEYYDFKKVLLEKEKVNKDFLNRIKLLSLEELIYLKLDSLTISLKGKLMGFPIMKMFPDICREALIRYALSISKNKRDAANIIGVDLKNLNKLLKTYKIEINKK